MTDIDGASFSGFYYIAFQKSKGTIDGYYYYRSSEWYIVLAYTAFPSSSLALHESCLVLSMQVPIPQFGIQAKPNCVGVSISLTRFHCA